MKRICRVKLISCDVFSNDQNVSFEFPLSTLYLTKGPLFFGSESIYIDFLTSCYSEILILLTK